MIRDIRLDQLGATVRKISKSISILSMMRPIQSPRFREIDDVSLVARDTWSAHKDGRKLS